MKAAARTTIQKNHGGRKLDDISYFTNHNSSNCAIDDDDEFEEDTFEPLHRCEAHQTIASPVAGLASLARNDSASTTNSTGSIGSNGGEKRSNRRELHRLASSFLSKGSNDGELVVATAGKDSVGGGSGGGDVHSRSLSAAGMGIWSTPPPSSTKGKSSSPQLTRMVKLGEITSTWGAYGIFTR